MHLGALAFSVEESTIRSRYRRAALPADPLQSSPVSDYPGRKKHHAVCLSQLFDAQWSAGPASLLLRAHGDRSELPPLLLPHHALPQTQGQVQGSPLRFLPLAGAETRRRSILVTGKASLCKCFWAGYDAYYLVNDVFLARVKPGCDLTLRRQTKSAAYLPKRKNHRQARLEKPDSQSGKQYAFKIAQAIPSAHQSFPLATPLPLISTTTGQSTAASSQH